MDQLLKFAERFGTMFTNDPAQFGVLCLILLVLGWVAGKKHASQQVAAAIQQTAAAKERGDMFKEQLEILKSKIADKAPDRAVELKRLDVELTKQVRLGDKQNKRSDGNEAASTAHGNSLPKQPIDDRTLIGDVTPEYLFSLYQDHITVQADKLAQAYLGKWIKISGLIQNVNDSTDGRSLLAVYLEKDRTQLLLLYFSREWADRLAVLGRNQPVAAAGKVKSIDITRIELIECELV
jgi:hypothetical protein